MSLRTTLSTNFEAIEKASIAVTFFSILIGFFISDSEAAVYLRLGTLLGLGALWVLYFALSRNDLYRWPLGMLVFYIFGSLFSLFDWEGKDTLFLGFYAAYLIFGAMVLFQAYKDSVNNKNFEMLAFLMGFFIIIAPLMYFLKGKDFEQIRSFYHFALAFIIATIMYNDNLWERFSFNGKNIVKYIFILTLVYILTSSAKFLNL